jgi:hypothetical protein
MYMRASLVNSRAANGHRGTPGVYVKMSAHFNAARDFIETPIQFDSGYWTMKPCVGLGITVDEAFAARLQGRNEPLLTSSAIDPDGTLVDW